MHPVFLFVAFDNLLLQIFITIVGDFKTKTYLCNTIYEQQLFEGTL